MKFPDRDFSALELCITALYIYCAFFVVTVAAELFATDALARAFAVGLAAAAATGCLIKVWLEQTETRGHIVNVALLFTAFLIATDTAAAIDN
ncbi:MAG: hypothetical protein V2I27_10990 [Erythrobacter sp.]|jgi:hypothetical protein|nr:hypothetical protein [Erythrobacter sp.]